MNNLAILTDSTCTLPLSILNKYPIRRVPITLNIGGQSLPDPCRESYALELFRSGKLKRNQEVSTTAPTVLAFEAEIQRALDEGYNNIVVQTINRAQGESYNNANTAIANIRRKLNGESRGMDIRVMDSRTVFAGQGLLVLETIRRCSSGYSQAELRRTLQKISTKVHSYILPRDPLTALERGRTRNENPIGWTQAFFANALSIHPIVCIVDEASRVLAKPIGFENAVLALFRHARIKIAKGLISPIVTITYSGPLEELKRLPGYEEMQSTAREHKVQIVPAVMSVTAGMYTTVGSISLAMVFQGEEWETREY